MTAMPPICVNQQDAAKMLGVSRNFFAGLGIKGVKLGRCIRYRVRDLEAYIAKKQEEQRPL